MDRKRLLLSIKQSPIKRGLLAAIVGWAIIGSVVTCQKALVAYQKWDAQYRADYLCTEEESFRRVSADDQAPAQKTQQPRATLDNTARWVPARRVR